MGDPKISIVLPTYNGSDLLRGSIDSCLNQTYRNIELIVIDDCSADEKTTEIIRSYTDPRVRRFRNEVNQQLPRSLNVGFSHAEGDYLTWTSDDNEYAPEALEKMLDCLREHPEADMVYADQRVYREETGETSLQKLPDTLDLRDRNMIGGCFLYTRRVYDTIGGYNPNYEVVEDYDYWIRLTRKFKAVHCAFPGYLYRFHAQAMSSTRVYDVALFKAVLKYRNGFVPLSGLGWTAAYYFREAGKGVLSAEAKRQMNRRALRKIRRLSFPFFLLFAGTALVFCAMEAVKSCLRAWGLLKKR